jgi:hypothetical protein
METSSGRVQGDFVERLIADYRLACFARALLENRSVAAAVAREE